MEQLSSKVIVIAYNQYQQDQLVEFLNNSLSTCLINLYLYITHIQDGSPSIFETILQNLYTFLSKVQVDNPLFSPSVILECINPGFLNKFDKDEILYFNESDNILDQQLQIQTVKQSKFKHTAMGGTFDYLHIGHKLLISSALLYTKESLIIGIAGSKLLSKKEYSEWIQPIEIRQHYVRIFANDFDPSVKLRIEEINDVAGPAAHDDKLEALILTQESIRGGEKTNLIRAENNLGALKLQVIDLIMHQQSKQSSSYIRSYLHDKNKGVSREFVLQCFLKIAKPCFEINLWTNLLSLLYSESQRYYHTLNHIKSLIVLNQNYQKQDCVVTIAAILFHDCIYDPKSQLNEEKSALLFEEFFRQVGQTGNININENEKLQISKWIRATKSHLSNTEQDEGLLYFLDLDLSILSSQQSDYTQYVKEIRSEYKQYSAEQFKQGRLSFLNSWIGKTLFRSKELSNLNIQAQVNIKNEIEEYNEL